MKISGKMLDQAKTAEGFLAKEEARRIEDSLPKDHPLMPEIERTKAALGGDLGGLPPGHPLLRAMEAAKRNFDAKRAVETDKENVRSDVKKVKKLDVEKVRQDAKKVARRQEEETHDKRREAAGQVNGKIDILLGEAKDLLRVVADNEEVLGTDPFSRSKVERLKRMLFAAERGVSECRIARI